LDFWIFPLGAGSMRRCNNGRSIGGTTMMMMMMMMMMSAAKYSALDLLRDGRRIEIRALRTDDRADLLGAVERTSAQSLYRRFFGVKRDFSEKEIEFFVNVDFVNHVAWVATVEERNRTVIVGGGRYVIVRPGMAEVAFAVVDQYQHRQSVVAPSRRDCPRRPARETGRRGSSGQYSDAEGLREKRAPLHDQAGRPRRSLTLRLSE
jgi:hypothetical protein